MDDAEMEHNVLLIAIENKIRSGIQDTVRDFGKGLKKKNISTKEFYLLVLRFYKEALENLAKEAKEE